MALRVQAQIVILLGSSCSLLTCRFDAMCTCDICRRMSSSWMLSGGVCGVLSDQAEGVEVLARLLHPDAIMRRCPENAVLKLALQGGQRCRQRLVPNYFLPFQ